ncbi:MAG: protease modulator HflC [Planctomycetes bacterium]|nr:protease modulator HflC [Planctomycetota bacterium]
MKSNRFALIATAVIALVLCLKMCLFTVQSNELAVVMTFGKPTGEDAQEGAHAKWPWPIQQVARFDKRLRVLEGPLEEIATADKRAILVGTFALWRIKSGRKFLEQIGDPAEAEHKLQRILRSHQAAAIGRTNFGQLVSADRKAQTLRYDQVEEQIRAGMQAEVEELGIEVKMVGIRRLGLPQRVTEAVFGRMREDRNTLATAIREKGKREAETIKQNAETERLKRILAAKAKAKGTLAQAEREAAVHYRKLGTEPELAVFLKKLEALKRILADPDTTMIFGPGDLPFDLLRSEAAPVTSQGRK